MRRIKKGICIVCGEEFEKKHGPEKYCSNECRTHKRNQQCRINSHKWYHKHKKELTEKQRWGLGSGAIGAHMHSNFEKEEKVIKSEMKRLRIKGR